MKERTTHHNACDCREAEFAKLRAFAQDVMRAWPEGDVDGGELQAAAIRHGLLRETHPKEPCGEGCTCVEYYSDEDFTDGTAYCYKPTELLSPNAGNQR
jgi:hypothetical protein